MMQRHHTEEQWTGHTAVPAQPRQTDQAPARRYREIDFSSLVGPVNALERVIEEWAPLVGTRLRSVTSPRILPLPPGAEEYGSHVLRVAAVRHEVNLGPALIRRLRAQLRLLQISDVVAELGYFLAPTAARDAFGAAESWSVSWEARHLDMLRRRFEVPLATDVLGAAFAGHWEFPRRIALIDTGDAGAAAQLGFDMESTKVEQPGDHYGHGTAVGSLIRMTAPQAELHSYRVMRTGENLVESTVLLNAMTSATMTIGEYHVVAIPQRATLSTRARGQDDAMQRIVRQNAARGYPTPVIVCAAGNFGPHERMDYPAIVPGVVVAVGLDWSGRPASYNCRAPAGVSVHCVGAIGGIQKDPLGTMAGPNRSARALYGSSYATALVAGSLASAPTKS